MSDFEENITGTVMYDYSSYYLMEGLDYSPCDSTNVRNFGKVFLPTLYSLVFILGFLGNGLVVCVLVNHRNKTNLTDICLFNLALSDLLFALTLPFYTHFSMASKWIFGDFMCRFVATSHSTGFFSSIFSMVVMTLDRYAIIMHAHTVARYRTLKTGILFTLLVWLLSVSVSLPAFVYTKMTNESGCDSVPDSDEWRLYNLVSTNILGLVIPLLVMVVCYSRIIHKLKGMRTVKKHRIVKLIIAIVFAFFLFWAPFNLSLFLGFLNSKDKLKGNPCKLDADLKLAIIVTEAFAYTHCCLNPIIYAFMGQKFMKRVLQLLKTWVPAIPSVHLSDSTYRKSSAMSRSSAIHSTVIN